MLQLQLPCTQTSLQVLHFFESHVFSDDLGAVADAHDEKRAQNVPTEGVAAAGLGHQ